MVDLIGQYQKIKPEVDKAIHEVLEAAYFVGGPQVKQFQENLENYLGVKHVIPCANGTDALQVSMMALGLKPGDEVITTSFTFIATAEAVSLAGAVPVFVDCDEYFNMDVQKLKGLLDSRQYAGGSRRIKQGEKKPPNNPTLPISAQSCFG